MLSGTRYAIKYRDLRVGRFAISETQFPLRIGTDALSANVPLFRRTRDAWSPQGLEEHASVRKTEELAELESLRGRAQSLSNLSTVTSRVVRKIRQASQKPVFRCDGSTRLIKMTAFCRESLNHYCRSNASASLSEIG